MRNHGRYRAIDGNIVGMKDALARAGARRLTVCSADPWKWSFLGLSLDGPFKVVAPGALAAPDGSGEAEVFVALDRAPGGPPPELAGYRLAGRTRPDPEAPWLDMTRLVVAVKP